MTLRGVTVLVTRQREQASDLVSAIEGRGGQAVVVPMIKVVAPVEWDECDRAFEALDSYDGAVFTSPNAVLWFFRRLRERGMAVAALSRCAVFAVGPTTRETLEEHGISVAGIPADASVDGLAEMLRGWTLRGQRFLLPRGKSARRDVQRVLEESGAIVDSPVVYRTIPPGAEEAQRLVALTARGSYSVVVFASPSAAENFANVVPAADIKRLVSPPKIVAIGQTTAGRLLELGFSVDRVAEEAGTEGLIVAIEQVAIP